MPSQAISVNVSNPQKVGKGLFSYVAYRFPSTHISSSLQKLLSCQSGSIPTYGTDSLMVSFPDNPQTSLSEVISDQTTSNFLVYNLQLPHITSNFLMVAMVIMFAMVIMVATVMVVMVVVVNMVVLVDRTGRDGTN